MGKKKIDVKRIVVFVNKKENKNTASISIFSYLKINVYLIKQVYFKNALFIPLFFTFSKYYFINKVWQIDR